MELVNHSRMASQYVKQSHLHVSSCLMKLQLLKPVAGSVAYI